MKRARVNNNLRAHPPRKPSVPRYFRPKSKTMFKAKKSVPAGCIQNKENRIISMERHKIMNQVYPSFSKQRKLIKIHSLLDATLSAVALHPSK
ncbi:hypothetical protein LR48_Vigan118s002700 [Vigna angularis]|uniref:Uncharacterized protein n=1 Tax=Phaseolus angularis TaxID=3914 RepID=A0A0L9T4S2_PHAAN|nr:hypothetical protein LR48_Vigan118s002700 [Vigna angularis]